YNEADTVYPSRRYASGSSPDVHSVPTRRSSDLYDRLVELNVQEQCVNVIKYAVVQQRYAQEGFPTVHGWVMDIRTGELKDLHVRSEEHTSELQSRENLVCRLLLEKKKKRRHIIR